MLWQCDCLPVIVHVPPRTGVGPPKLHPFEVSASSWSVREGSGQNMSKGLQSMQAIPWLICQVLFRPSILLEDAGNSASRNELRPCKEHEKVSVKPELRLASDTWHRWVLRASSEEVLHVLHSLEASVGTVPSPFLPLSLPPQPKWALLAWDCKASFECILPRVTRVVCA